MTIFIYPSHTTEGEVYARMLSIELRQEGIANLKYEDPEETAEGEVPGCYRGIRCALALIDTARKGYAALGRALKQEGIPLLFYGYARPSLIDMGYGEAETMPNEEKFFLRPIRPKELLAECHAILERSAADPLHLGRSHKECAYGGRILQLTPIEHRVLTLLHERKGETVDRQTLYEQCWNLPRDSSDAHAASNVVDACLRNLRRKLEDPLGRKLLYSVRGVGYRYEDRLTAEQEASKD